MIRFVLISGIILLYTVTVLSFTIGDAGIVHVCCYSKDPSLYPPKCYDCNKMVYKNALLACLNATDMPNNISYNAANCMEKNCQIEPPKLTESESKYSPFIDMFSKFLTMARAKRSIFDNNVDGSDSNEKTGKSNIVEQVHTFVSVDTIPIQFGEPEYM
ncbi:uncharacterized protein TNIN_362271 [Trichonephila inaurata madagascariensis]|uniref:Uncharacterized protein n=1 Tax=Trichonephila inaurata madagascariensis TaxID=2747483 RepID=A0A8X6XI45_9ARAC|nr:uncharacterized protein TNIN_362271 [Trichonephila inaurata madagascariensis]